MRSVLLGTAAFFFLGTVGAVSAGDKIEVCHKDKLMTISIKALGGHLGHGDYLFTCEIFTCDAIGCPEN